MNEYHELTESQKTIFAAANRKNDTSYNLVECIEIEDTLDLLKIQQAFDTTINQNESLKTQFVVKNRQISQYKSETASFDLNVISVDCDEEAEELIRLFNAPFQRITESDLVKCLLIQQRMDKFYFVICAHHLIVDGLSLMKLLYDLMDEYYGKKITTAPISIYELYEMKNKKITSLKAEAEAYWVNELQGMNMINLPFRQSVNNEMTNKANTLYYSIDSQLSQTLNQQAKENNVTLFEYLVTLFNIMLVKMSGQKDIVVGVPLSGRNLRESHQAIGMFVNTLPMRYHYDGKETLKDALNQTHQKFIQMNKYQDCSFEGVLNKLTLKKEKNREMLFDVLFSYYDASFSSSYPHISRKKLINDSAQFFITMNVMVDHDKNILLKMEYFKELFDEDLMELVMKRYEATLIAAGEEKKLSQLGILSTGEKELVTKIFNNTEVPYNHSESLVKKIDKFALLIPDKVALVCKGKRITYSELNQMKKNYIALLKENQVVAQQVVGIQADRSPEMVAAILAIWSIGAVYVPIDKVFPAERIKHIIGVTNMRCLFQDSETNGGTLLLKHLVDPLTDSKEENMTYQYSPEDLAYIIFTSGSTGLPKGAMVTHLGMTNHLLSKKILLDLDTECIIMQNATHVFDISIWQFFSALSAGGTTVIVTDEENRNIGHFLELALKEKVNTLEVVPSYLQLLVNRFKNNNELECPLLDYLLVTGEKVNQPLVQEWFSTKQSQKTKLINAYGPTEAADDITHHVIEPSDCSGEIPIGKTINNMRIYILDRDDGICGVGIEGEICVSGLGVGRGYIANEEKTKAAFVQNPYEDEKMYRTGDLGFWRKDGAINYLGRKDDQIKIRGFRIELGEIENRLKLHPEVAHAVVMKNDQNELVAYVSFLNKETTFQNEALDAYLKNYLPTYMVPNYIVKVAEFPLNINGKIDRGELQKMKTEATEKKITPPGTDTEQKLFTIWADVLEMDDFGIDDLFIELYGNSIKAIYMVDLIQESFGIELDVEHIFDLDTIRKQAAYIDGKDPEQTEKKLCSRKEQELTVVSSAQKRVFLATNLFKDSITYNMPALFLLNQKLSPEKMYSIFSKIIQNHPNLRTNFVMKNEDVYQRTYEKADETGFTVEVVHEDNQSETFLVEKYTQPFDLEKDCLLRVIFIKNGSKNYLFFDLSHIISDGLSLQILITEFCQLYNNQSISPEKLTYQDFLTSNEVKSETYLQKREHWLQQFKDVGEIVGIPYDKQLKIKTETGATERLILDQHYLDKLREFSIQHSVSFQTILFTIYSLVLAKITGKQDVTIGTVSMGRKKYGYRNTVGMFVNTLPLRVKVNQSDSFLDLLQQVKEVSSKAIDNEEYQYDTLLKELKQESSITQLFSSLFIFQDAYIDRIEAGSLELNLVNHDQLTSKFDTEYQIFITNEHLILELSYLTCLYEAESMQRVLLFYKRILDQLIMEEKFSISQLTLLSVKEEKAISARRKEYESVETRSLITLFQSNVAKFPHKVAVIEGEKTISYEMLDIVSDRLAAYLQQTFGNNIYAIGIEMDHSITMMVSILAVLKTGAMYIPLDSKLPLARRIEMLRSGEAACLLSDTKKSYDGISVQVIDWLMFNEVTEDQYQVHELSGETGACIVYTSGTTGKPKGNVVKHQNIIRVIDEPNYVEIPSDHVMMQPSNFSFDGSFFNIFGSICNGGTLVLCEIKRLLDLSYIEELIKENKITHFFVTTSLFNVWVENIVEAMVNVDYILIGGESASVRHCQMLFDSSFSGTLINGYGPTESTFFATAYKMTKKAEVSDPIPIGQPISKTSVYLINENHEVLPAGIQGEIAIGGTGLIREYVGNPILYQERFVQLNGEQVYLTGDRGKVNQEDQLIFFGRKDHQIKHNGYRIELNEVEAVLTQYFGVQQAVVLYSKQYKKIFGFVVVNENYQGMDILKEYLNEKLPVYMQPSTIEILSEFPLNKNGKVDRTALEQRMEREEPLLDEAIHYDDPLLAATAKILNQGVLIGKDNFYEKGGDSIKAIQISAELLKQGYELQANDILVAANFDELSKRMKRVSSLCNVSYEGPVGLLPNHKQYLEMNKDVYHFLQSVLLETDHIINREAVKKAIETVLLSHDMLRSVFHKNQLICKPQEELAYNFFDYDFSEETKEIADKKIQEVLQVLKKSVDLEKGPVFFAAIFKGPDKEHLLLCCHHFMLDSVSWRIILGDFFQQYFSTDESIADSLIRTTSFKEWVDMLNEYTATNLYQERVKYWQQIEAVKTKQTTKRTANKKQHQRFEIEKKQSKDLLNQANRSYTTEPNHLLVAALVESINAWQKKSSSFKIIMENHGREIISKKINLSRTVGWFTTIYPFLVDQSFETIGATIKWTKEQMNTIPNKGLDYGLFRYSDKKAEKDSPDEKELVSFNFLGDLSSGFDVDEFSLSTIPNSGDQGEEIELLAAIEVTAMVVEQQVILTFTYEEECFSYGEIHLFGEIMCGKVAEIISHCLKQKMVQQTPSDFSDPSLLEEEIVSINELFS